MAEMLSSSRIEPPNAPRSALWRAGGRVLLAFGILMIGVSWVLGRPLVALRAEGLRAQGIVRSLERAGGSHGGAYYPRVSFTTSDGSIIRFRDASGSNPAAYRVGDRVAVLYLAGDSRSAIIDRGVRNWVPALLALACGAVLSLASLRLLKNPLAAA